MTSSSPASSNHPPTPALQNAQRNKKKMVEMYTILAYIHAKKQINRYNTTKYAAQPAFKLTFSRPPHYDKFVPHIISSYSNICIAKCNGERNKTKVCKYITNISIHTNMQTIKEASKPTNKQVYQDR